MKKIKFLLIIVLFLSCTVDLETKEYKFLVYYQARCSTGNAPDTITYIGKGRNTFFLRGGDLIHHDAYNKTLVSGITRFEVLSVKKITNEK